MKLSFHSLSLKIAPLCKTNEKLKWPAPRKIQKYTSCSQPSYERTQKNSSKTNTCKYLGLTYLILQLLLYLHLIENWNVWLFLIWTVPLSESPHLHESVRRLCEICWDLLDGLVQIMTRRQWSAGDRWRKIRSTIKPQSLQKHNLNLDVRPKKSCIRTQCLTVSTENTHLCLCVRIIH